MATENTGTALSTDYSFEWCQVSKLSLILRPHPYCTSSQIVIFLKTTLQAYLCAWCVWAFKMILIFKFSFNLHSHREKCFRNLYEPVKTLTAPSAGVPKIENLFPSLKCVVH